MMPPPGGPESLRLDARTLTPADRSAWSALADRAAEPNPFFRPEFSLANMTERGVRLQLYVVRDTHGWLACVPAQLVRRSLRMPLRTFEAMIDEYSFLSTPLLDRDRIDEAAQGLVDVIRREADASAVVFKWWAPDGPVAAAVQRVTQGRSQRPIVVGETSRAAWRRAESGRSPGSSLHGDRLRHLKAKARELAKQLGELQIEDRTGDPAAWDAFLEMENSGWKAKRGNPMAAVAGDAAFFRRMSEGMGATGHYRLLALEGGGRMVAMESQLIDGDALFAFKIAYDPAFGHLSPGTQLHASLVDRLHDQGFRVADSCAASDNSHSNRVWPDRRPLQTVVFPTSGLGAFLVGPIISLRHLARAIREQLRRQPSEVAPPAAGHASRR